MSTAKISLIGLTKFDSSLFDDLHLPDGIDKDLFINSLLLKGGEFEVLYPEPDFMRFSIGVWGRKWYRTFAEWLKGTRAEWNPIYNYDRYEESADSNSKTFGNKTTADYSDNRTADLTDKRTADLTDKRTADLTDKRTADLTDKRTADLKDERTANLTDEQTLDNSDTTTQTESAKTEHEVSAYDSSSYVPSSRDTVNNGTTQTTHNGTITGNHTGTDTTAYTGTDTNTQTGTDTTAHTGTDTTAHTGTDTTAHTGTDNIRHTGTLSDTAGNESGNANHNAHIYGNIGVTQSSDMLKSFYDIAEWSLYDHMSDVFVRELLIPVY